MSLRFVSRVSGDIIEVQRGVHALRATLGREDARPVSGSVRFKLGLAGGVVGSNVTAPISVGSSIAEVKHAFESLTILTDEEKPVSVRSLNGSWLVSFADGGEKVIKVYENSLFPVSYGRVRVQWVDGVAVHDLRFTQSPVAFTDAFAPVVPLAPVIEALRDGGEEAGNVWNEVQVLKLNPAFRGTFQLSRGFKKTGLLSAEDGLPEIAEALALIADEDGEFRVTNPVGTDVHIEFAGSMKGINQDLLVLSVFNAPPGDATFTLSLDTAELATLLNGSSKASEKLPLEIYVELESEYEGGPLTKLSFRSELEVQRELSFEGLALAQSINWIRPPLPRDYIPFTPDQVNTGILHYSTTLGNGVLTSFTVDHNLSSESVLVLLRENAAPGAVLRSGVDYALTIEGEDSVSLDLLGDYLETPPLAGGLAVTVLAMGQASQFNAHNHSIAQVLLLPETLAAMSEAIAALQAAVGLSVSAGSSVTTSTTGPTAEWTLRRVALLYPTRETVDLSKAESVADIAALKLPRAGGLLPAVHDTASEALPSVLPTAPTDADEGRVYQNLTGATVLLPGGNGRASVKLKANEYAALLVEEGRVSWYRVAKVDAAKSSWYPTDFERELFVIPVNEAQFRVGKKLTLQVGFEAAVLASNALAQWELRIEFGTAADVTTPGTPDKNVGTPVWDTAHPILTHRFHLSPDPTTHKAGCVLTRGAGGITGNGILYDATIGALNVPSSANFFLRGRLCKFDTQDGEADPRGFVSLVGLDKAMGGTKDDALGKVTITSAAVS